MGTLSTSFGLALALLAPSCSGNDEGAGPAAPALEDGSARDTGDDALELEALRALGYASGYEDVGAGLGVTVYDRDSAQPGMNLYVSGHLPVAYLLDMEGRELHRWQFDALGTPEPPDEAKRPHWRRVRVTERGELFAIFDQGAGLVKLDRDSRLLWAFRSAAHHDLDVHEDGRVFVLERRPRDIPWITAEKQVNDDYITILSPDGEELEAVSLADCFARTDGTEDLRKLIARRSAALRARGQADGFHTNTLQLLDGRHADRSTAFARGNVLVSMRNMDLLAIVDLEQRSVPWTLRGKWKMQHQPELLDSGTLLLFDNLGTKGSSEVLEIDPLTGETLWSYRGRKPQEFFSRYQGSCQRLPNGNTLIVETQRGRVFEVTPEGETVWRFETPHRAGKEGELTATVPDMLRLPADFPTDWLE